MVVAAVAVAIIGGTAARAYMPPAPVKMGDKLSSDYFNKAFADIATKFTDVDKQIAALQGEPACPRGYSDMGGGVCAKGADEMVKVGTGPAAFWIDRYEASVWSDSAGTMGKAAGVPWGISGDDYPMSFPKNGQRIAGFKDLFAVSKMGVMPSASLTWFQAQQACRASGKRLPSDEEWLAAASGTPDPTMASIGGPNGDCVTGAQGPRVTGGAAVQSATHCQSVWGAQDMIGNLWEWTGEWYAGAGDTLGKQYVNRGVQNWPAAFNGDGTWNVAAYTDIGSGPRAGLPAAMMRGGGWDNGVPAGAFAIALDSAPSSLTMGNGFRCAVR